MPGNALRAINTAGPLLLIAVIVGIGVYALLRWRRADTREKRSWWRLRALAMLALALFIALNQYALHLHWPG